MTLALLPLRLALDALERADRAYRRHVCARAGHVTSWQRAVKAGIISHPLCARCGADLPSEGTSCR